VKSRKNYQQPHKLDDISNEGKRQQSLQIQSSKYKEIIEQRDPKEIARLTAMSLQHNKDGQPVLSGEHLLETHNISWPDLTITDSKGNPVSLKTETLWLHYLNRADGHPLTRRWVNLSEIGGLFYQQAFQGYCGDELAKAWGSDLEGFKKSCLAAGGWEMQGPGDLAFEWRILPRVPLCICYQLPTGGEPAWATVLFDSAAGHYIAADVAAVVGKELADRLKP